MAKSRFVEAVDAVQKSLRPMLEARGFKVRGRTFNRQAGRDLIQVINFQMGASLPPGAAVIPGLREDLHGLFTVNLGVYVPEVARHHVGGEARSWVQEYSCCVRARLADACGELKDRWWPARNDEEVAGDLRSRLERGGLPFLERFSTRDRILSELDSDPKSLFCPAPRIVMAIILATRGEHGPARALLARQAGETRNPGHPAYVRKLARELELGDLDEE